ncbi:hypothetical protein BC834DRAFT_896085 [Gloeopeniophorella convolvens]|nr:hypothetical protein BC834DRAFT_896085 [Gloeopeniophorella convolvens]
MPNPVTLGSATIPVAPPAPILAPQPAPPQLGLFEGAIANVGNPGVVAPVPTQVGFAGGPTASGVIIDPSPPLIAPLNDTAPWPAATNHVFVAPGSPRITLMQQSQPVRLTISGSFENLHAFIMFRQSFPSAERTISFIHQPLVLAASRIPGAAEVQRRLLNDQEHLQSIAPLPRARISHFRGSVKDRCASAVAMMFNIHSSPAEIARTVEKQLNNYTYIFAKGPNAASFSGPAMRTRPYRNPAIIMVIRGLYFSPGISSFANRHKALFPRVHANDGTINLAAPKAMVALVATGLYAALNEWRTGEFKSADFAATTYLDVYNGHIAAMEHIETHRNDAFNVMMTDAYHQVITGAPSAASSTTEIATIDLDTLEG